MASMWKNLGNLFGDARSRVIIIFTGVVLIGATVVGLYALRNRASGPTAGVTLVRAPGGIQSIPGSLDPSAQYAKLQEKQNLLQAQRALKTGGSALPTIIRTQKIGEGQTPKTQGAVGFQTLSREAMDGGIRKSLWLNNLKQANCSPASVNAATKQGATLKDIREICSCVQLKAAGFQAAELQPVCSCTALKAAGFNATDMKNSGYTAGQLRLCGYNACQLKAAGYTAQEMKDGGYTDGELKGAGYGDADIKAASGLPPGISAADVRRAGCSVDALKREREAGVSAAAIRRYSGCTAAQLKAAGYTARELKNAGFTPAELKAAGFTPAELRNAGFSAKQLRDAGFTPAQLRAAGYSPDQIRQAEDALPPGVTSEQVRRAGCDINALKRERAAGISAASIRRYAGCNAAQLKAAGYSDQDLKNAGFSPAEIARADQGLPPGVTTADIKKSGCSIEALKHEREKGVSAAAIRKYAGCSAAQLKAAGFGDQALKNAGFTPEEIAAANTALPPGITADDVRKAGCSAEALTKLRARGVSAAAIRKYSGCTAKQLKAAGYTAKELKNAGFFPSAVAAAMVPKNAAEAIKMLRKTGCNITALRKARALGVTARQIRNTIGCSAAALKAAGYTARELKNAGFTPAELKNAGFSAKQLRDAGFTAKQLANAGFSPKELKDAGFSAKQLKDAGLSAAQLRAAGFSPRSIKAAGYSKQALQDAGLLPKDMKPDATPSVTPPTQFGTTGSEPEKAVPTLGGQPVTDKALQAALARQASQMTEQRLEAKIQQRQGQMSSNASTIISGWAPVEQVYMAGDLAKKQADEESARAEGFSSAADRDKAKSKQAEIELAKHNMFKAGDIIFAVLNTAVNSDEPGPILATVVTGKYKGAKLIGSMRMPGNHAKKVILSFNLMSLPEANSTIPISAVGIDPNTARTAVATSYDRHLLLRYGSLFASSFLEGYGQSISTKGTMVTVNGSSTLLADAGRSASENAAVGLGKIGQRWGQQLAPIFNRPYTVKVKSGTSLGVLFTSDVASASTTNNLG